MAKSKSKALSQAPIAVKRQAAYDPTDTVPVKRIKDSTPRKHVAEPRAQDKFTYALKAYTAERRNDGWWIARTPFWSIGEKPEWSGPFEHIETACLAIARRLATEVADRHTRSIEAHKLKPDDVLYGLKPCTTLAED